MNNNTKNKISITEERFIELMQEAKFLEAREKYERIIKRSIKQNIEEYKNMPEYTADEFFRSYINDIENDNTL